MSTHHSICLYFFRINKVLSINTIATKSWEALAWILGINKIATKSWEELARILV